MPQKVLVADPDHTTLELVTAVLTRDGFEVLATPDGVDALARFFESSPSVVVCAVSLPSVSGKELCRQIKARSAETRVVLMDRNPDAAKLAGETGCDAVLGLPFKYSDLKKLLVDWRILTSPDAGAYDSGDFRVPTSEHFKLELQPAAPSPPPAPPASSTARAPSRPSTSDSIPPLPVPVPLPVAPPPQEPAPPELPELELDLISHEVPEMELGDVVVEPTPAAPTKPAAAALGVPLEGTLGEYPFPRLLYKLYLATFSGVIHLASTAANRSVYISGGIPVRVDSKQLSESLGRMLLEHGRITMEQYHESMRIMTDRGIRHGEAMISIGAINDADLLDALRTQTELKVANTFAWREAAFRIEPRADFASGTALTEVHPLKAIWRGVSEHYDIDSLYEYFTPLRDRYVVGTELFSVYYDTLGVHLRDLNMPAQLTGRKTVEQILHGDKRTLQVAQALYVLLVTDMARMTNAPGVAVAAPQSSGAAADFEAKKRLGDEILAEWHRLRDADHFDALRVDPASRPDEVDAAYSNIVSVLRLDEIPSGMPDQVLRAAREIKQILARARAIVRDPVARDRYMFEQQPGFAIPERELVPDVFVPSATRVDGEIVFDEIADHAPLELDIRDEDAFAAERNYAEGQGFMAEKLYAEAAEKFRAAITFASGEPSYRVALGKAIWLAEAETEVGRDHFVACLQQALQLDPSHIDANLEMARLLVISGNNERAYAYVQRVLQRQPSHPEARRLLASLG